jgi:hypothetical protein
LYDEWRWFCIVDQRFDQYTGFVKFFSYHNGSYELKPSDYVINLWTQDTAKDGNPDYRGENASFAYESGMPVVQKYLYGVNDAFTNDADLFIYRTGTLYLRYAEIVNRMGKCGLAMAVLNPDFSLAQDPRARNDNLALEYLDFYNDSIRTTTVLTHSRDRGIRGRVSMPPVYIDSTFSHLDSIEFIENYISLEYAKELAFEGDRWSNLLRFAHRKEILGEDGAAFLADAVAAKFEAKGDMATAAEIRSKLSDKENWYLPLY